LLFLLFLLFLREGSFWVRVISSRERERLIEKNPKFRAKTQFILGATRDWKKEKP
jgi:hypothetical protein